MPVSLESIIAIIAVIVALPPSLLIIVTVARQPRRAPDPGAEAGLPRQHHAFSPHETSTRLFHQQSSLKQAPYTIQRSQVMPKNTSSPQDLTRFHTPDTRSIYPSSTWPAVTSTIIQPPRPKYQLPQPRCLHSHSAPPCILSSRGDNSRCMSDPQPIPTPLPRTWSEPKTQATITL